MARRPRSSQDAWTRGEALERAGKGEEAVDLYVRAAVAEEDAHRPLRARLLWEQVARRTGVTGTLLERIASACGRAHLDEDAFHYWVAAGARFHAEGRAQDAQRAKAHAAELKQHGGKPEREMPPLAAEALRQDDSFVRDLLAS